MHIVVLSSFLLQLSQFNIATPHSIHLLLSCDSHVSLLQSHCPFGSESIKPLSLSHWSHISGTAHAMHPIIVVQGSYFQLD